MQKQIDDLNLALGGKIRGAERAAIPPRRYPVYQPEVGYQPVIVVLPEGTNFGVSAVVSSDRRYVRITAVPVFSGIPKVRTFRYQ